MATRPSNRGSQVRIAEPSLLSNREYARTRPRATYGGDGDLSSLCAGRDRRGYLSIGVDSDTRRLNSAKRNLGRSGKANRSCLR
jgi:hypothetical protein